MEKSISGLVSTISYGPTITTYSAAAAPCLRTVRFVGSASLKNGLECRGCESSIQIQDKSVTKRCKHDRCLVRERFRRKIACKINSQPDTLAPDVILLSWYLP